MKFINYCLLSIAVFLLVLVTSEPTLAQTPVPSNFASSISWWQAFCLGVVQGLTEFIPISSTAHLKVIPVALGWGDPGVAFTAVIQLGSIAAVLWYFWRDLQQVFVGSVTAIATKDYTSREWKLALGIALGTIPILVGGLTMKILIKDLDGSDLRSVTTIAIASIVMALLLACSEYVGSHSRNFDELSTKDGIIIGLAQTLALIPGVSRSGSTMTAALFNGLDRATAARFSFLLGIPAITIAGLVELASLFEVEINPADILPLIVGVISSAIFSYIAIAWLVKFLQKHKTWVFVWYRLAFGVLLLLVKYRS